MMKVGDIVLVDVGYPDGGYEAKILWLGKLFASIEAGGDRWDIMKRRLTEK